MKNADIRLLGRAIEEALGRETSPPPFVNEGAGMFDRSEPVREAMAAFATCAGDAATIQDAWTEFRLRTFPTVMVPVQSDPARQVRAEGYHRVMEVIPDAVRTVFGVELTTGSPEDEVDAFLDAMQGTKS